MLRGIIRSWESDEIKVFKVGENLYMRKAQGLDGFSMAIIGGVLILLELFVIGEFHMYLGFAYSYE